MSELTTNSEKRKHIHKAPGKLGINMADVFRLRYVHHLSLEDIAKRYNTSKVNIFKRLNNFLKTLPVPDEYKAYLEHRTPVLNLAELTLLKRIFDPAKLDAASLNNVAYAFQQIFNARRLESGQSTANIAVHQISTEEEESLRKYIHNTQYGDKSDTKE